MEVMQNPRMTPFRTQIVTLLALSGVVTFINCVTISVIWRKSGKRPSSTCLCILLLSCILYSTIPPLNVFRMFGYFNSAFSCASFGIIRRFCFLYFMLSSVGVFYEMTHHQSFDCSVYNSSGRRIKTAYMSNWKVHSVIFLLATAIALPGSLTYNIRSIEEEGIEVNHTFLNESHPSCVRCNILGSRILATLNEVMVGIVAYVLPGAYVIYSWYKAKFKLKYLDLKGKSRGILARKVNQIRWSLLFTLCYLLLLAPVPVAILAKLLGVIEVKDKPEGYEKWSFRVQCVMFLQITVQPMLVLFIYNYTPCPQFICCCRKARGRSHEFELTTFTRRVETVALEVV